MDRNTKDILESLDFIKQRLLTKDDVREIVREEVSSEPFKEGIRAIVREEVSSPAFKEGIRSIVREEAQDIRVELVSIRRDLDDLRAKVENVIQFRKEIDHAFERIAAIEKHLGIERKLAA